MFKDIAKKYLKAGINPVPVELGEKIPERNDWVKPIGPDIDKFDFAEIGICTGAVSGGLEALDFDLDVIEDIEERKEFFKDWCSRIPEDLLKKMVVCKTPSGGYHLIYRTEVSEGNRKLARLTKTKTVIETRGEGGYIKCFPSQGYKIVRGKIEKAQQIDNNERNILFATSMLYDKVVLSKKKFYSAGEFKDPFPQYNADPDIGVDLLVKHGWNIERESGGYIELTRPGKSRGISAGYNTENNFLYVFSTSTEFETEKPISNSAIYCILEHNEDFQAGYRALGKMGYGSKDRYQENGRASKEDLADLDFICRAGEDEKELEQAIDGTLALGSSYGWPALDEYHVWKENTLNLTLAFEGVGKTFFELHKLTALAVLYGKKFALSCAENKTWAVKRMLYEAVSGKPITYFKDRKDELNPYKEFIHQHFFIIRNDEHYSVEDVMDRAEVLAEKHKINGVFIDPFSFYKKTLTNQHAYIDDLLSKLNIFSKTICSIILSLHPVTEASRAPRDQEGYLKAPTRYDASFGNMWANRCDSFVVYHRHSNHKSVKMQNIMEVRQEKVKDKFTGGKVIEAGASISMYFKEVNGFLGFFDTTQSNPIYNAWHRKEDEIINIAELPSAQDAFDD